MDLEPNPLIEGSGLVAVGFGGGGGIRGSQESKISRGGVLARTNSCAKIGNWWGINRHGWEEGFVVLMEGKISFKRYSVTNSSCMYILHFQNGILIIVIFETF